MIVDSYNRVHDYLRISLTDNCNLRCFYCMPEEEYSFTPPSQLMQVNEIRELAEMITITAFDEVVVDSIKASKYDLVKNLTGFSAPGLSPAADRIVIITKGKVQAGTDLAYLMPDDIYTNDDSISLVLPPSKILDVISNPSDFSTFIETGDWPPAAVTSLKQKARALILNRALSNGILFRADQRSKLIMENFLRSLGFQKINISIGT